MKKGDTLIELKAIDDFQSFVREQNIIKSRISACFPNLTNRLPITYQNL